jgi:hypothetical protein
MKTRTFRVRVHYGMRLLFAQLIAPIDGSPLEQELDMWQRLKEMCDIKIKGVRQEIAHESKTDKKKREAIAVIVRALSDFGVAPTKVEQIAKKLSRYDMDHSVWAPFHAKGVGRLPRAQAREGNKPPITSGVTNDK